MNLYIYIDKLTCTYVVTMDLQVWTAALTARVEMISRGGQRRDLLGARAYGREIRLGSWGLWAQVTFN